MGKPWENGKTMVFGKTMGKPWKDEDLSALLLYVPCVLKEKVP